VSENNHEGWRSLSLGDLPEHLRATIGAEFPHSDSIARWLKDQFAQQASIADQPGSEDEFARWLMWQEVNGDPNLRVRKWPSLDFFLHSTHRSKALVLSQRFCRLCASLDAPIYYTPIRITPISRQAVSGDLFKAFQSAIKDWLSKRNIPIPESSPRCVAITFVLDPSKRDRDLDNMAKALQDAVSRALSFNDKHIQHLDLIKLFIPGTEEYVYIKMQASVINSNTDVVHPVINHRWATENAIDIQDYME
jgi:Holliday junction resolvase RusA-like endonuclease